MKSQTTLILLSLFLALAHGDTTVVNWAGNWDQKTVSSNTACYPDSTVLISQAVGTLTASWVWANSQPCIDAGLAKTQFTQTAPTPQDNSIDLKITLPKGGSIDGTFTITGDDAVFASNNGASATYSRRQQMVNWPGVWDIVTQDNTLCNPDGSITITQNNAGVTASWTWANSDPCTQAGLAGQTFSTPTAAPTGNVVAITVTAKEAVIAGIFAVIRDQAVFANALGASATFVRRQELVDWVGTWDLQTQQSTTACYPDGYVTVIPSGGNLTASWVWANSKPCTEFGLAGQPFTQSQPVPKGGAIFLDIFVGGAYVSGLFTATGDSSVFSSNNGASATFARRVQMVNWAGVWDVATQDKTVCSIDGSITVSQTTDNITLSWTWANTPACSILALAGKKFSQTVNLPTGNGVKLDVSSSNTTLSALLSLFLDGATFSSTTGASSTYIRKQENVAFAGTWNIQNQTSATACYPNTSIVITQASGNVTAKWTWANSAQCTAVGLAGKDFNQTEPTPRGKSIFLDIAVGTARVSGLFTVNGNKATFASMNGASAGFDRKVDPTSPGGSWTGTIIVILIIVAIAVAGYLYVQNRNKKLQGGNFDSSVSYNRA